MTMQNTGGLRTPRSRRSVHRRRSLAGGAPNSRNSGARGDPRRSPRPCCFGLFPGHYFDRRYPRNHYRPERSSYSAHSVRGHCSSVAASTCQSGEFGLAARLRHDAVVDLFRPRASFIKQSVGFYNLFNFANFDLPTSIMSRLLTGTASTINGTDLLAHNTNRVGVGTGVFTLGSPREIEFSLKITY